MKAKFIFLFLLTNVLLSYGQRLEVTKGPILDPKQIRSDVGVPKVILRSPFSSFSYSTTLFFNPQKKLTYTGFGFQDKAFHFAVLKDYLNYTGVKKLTAESINERVMLNAFILIDDKMYVIYSQKFADRDEFTVYVNEVSDDMVLLGSPVIVHKFKNLKQHGMNVMVTSSDDKKHILISRLCDTKPKEKQRLECKMVSQSFSESWYKLIETENLDKELQVKSIRVDNSGNMYMLVEFKVGKVNQPQLYSYFWKGQSLQVATAGLPAGENYGTKLKLLNGEKPYIVGLNDHEKKISYFVNRINTQTQQLEKLGSGPMPEDFYKASQFRVFDKEDWSVSDIVTLSDNSIVASIEAILLDTKYMLHYCYNTYVVSLNEEGEHNWSRTIQKKQSVMQGLAGHVLLPAGTNVLVIYNDGEENFPLRPEDTKVKGFTGKDAKPVVQEIDVFGKVQKYAFSTDKELAGWALYFNGMAKIKEDLYYTSAINIKSRFSIESRNMTFRVKP